MKKLKVLVKNILNFKPGAIVMLEATPEKRVYFLIVEVNKLHKDLYGTKLEVPSMDRLWRTYVGMDEVKIKNPSETNEFKRIEKQLLKNLYGNVRVN